MGVPHSPGKITVDEYYEMARVGLIDPDARVELIEGEIVAMAPIGNPHGMWWTSSATDFGPPCAAEHASERKVPYA
jgi:Uma2 family endonuclease